MALWRTSRKALQSNTHPARHISASNKHWHSCKVSSWFSFCSLSRSSLSSECYLSLQKLNFALASFLLTPRQTESSEADARISWTHFKRAVIFWKLLQHIISQAGHYSLPRLVPSTGAVLRLDAQDGVQHILGQLALVSNVGIGVQPKHFWAVIGRQALSSKNPR